MKRFMLIAITALSLTIGFGCVAVADGFQTVPELMAEPPAIVTHGLRGNTEAEGDQIRLAWPDPNPYGHRAAQRCERVQKTSDLSDVLVQARGSTCITPDGRCTLDDAKPINSRCCCPEGGCGYVGR